MKVLFLNPFDIEYYLITQRELKVQREIEELVSKLSEKLPFYFDDNSKYFHPNFCQRITLASELERKEQAEKPAEPKDIAPKNTEKEHKNMDLSLCEKVYLGASFEYLKSMIKRVPSASVKPLNFHPL